VGLAQREIEFAGFSTVTLSNIPELTAAVGVPRLVGIEFPFGQIVGRPGVAQDQLAVLQGTLDAVQEMQRSGCISSLPWKWDGTEPGSQLHPRIPPPIAVYLKRHPWQLLKLFSRDPP
jgi:hypothetical protein